METQETPKKEKKPKLTRFQRLQLKSNLKSQEVQKRMAKKKKAANELRVRKELVYAENQAILDGHAVRDENGKVQYLG